MGRRNDDGSFVKYHLWGSSGMQQVLRMLVAAEVAEPVLMFAKFRQSTSIYAEDPGMQCFKKLHGSALDASFMSVVVSELGQVRQCNASNCRTSS